MVAIHKIRLYFVKYNKNNDEENNFLITCYILRYAYYYNLKCLCIKLLLQRNTEKFVVRMKKYMYDVYFTFYRS